MIVIVDYGVGNLKSIRNMLNKAGASAVISSEQAVIDKAEKIILPGVGAFDAAVASIEKLKLRETLVNKVRRDRVPFLGICLGMQMLGAKSEEGASTGLGLIEAEAVRFNFHDNRDNLKIPHMGWNTINVKKEGRLFRDLPEEARFYFVHSYHLQFEDKSNIVCTTDYGYEFISGIEQDNVFGLQFHPEKSHRFGLRVLANFAELT